MNCKKKFDFDGSEIKITQDNQLIEACYSMSLNEKRLLILGMSKVNPMKTPAKDEPFKFKITEDEWQGSFPNANSYKAMKRAADALLTRYVTLHPKTGHTKKMSWFDSVEYIDYEACVMVQFSWSISLRLAGMIDQFTQIPLLEVNKLKSVYGVRLFELLNQFKATGYRVISLEDFRLAMDCLDKYPTNKALIQFVLKPALKDLKANSKLIIECKSLKKGRRITHFQLVFREGKQQDLFQ